MEGIIIKNESNNYTVKTEKGINICKPRGKFRLDKITPLVGDYVDIDDINNYILDIKKRKNSLIRPQIANVLPVKSSPNLLMILSTKTSFCLLLTFSTCERISGS